jgi:hypothetical protein
MSNAQAPRPVACHDRLLAAQGSRESRALSQLTVKHISINLEIAKHAVLIERRCIEAQLEAWDRYKAFKAKIEQMLKLSILATASNVIEETVTVTLEGGQVQVIPVVIKRTIVSPARWDYNTMARIARRHILHRQPAEARRWGCRLIVAVST